MVNVSSLLTVLASVAAAQACARTCEWYSDRNGKCLYRCWRACESLPETTVRNAFLRGLQRAGYDCRAMGVNEIECTKTRSFGTCSSHYWNCGKDC